MAGALALSGRFDSGGEDALQQGKPKDAPSAEAQRGLSVEAGAIPPSEVLDAEDSDLLKARGEGESRLYVRLQAVGEVTQPTPLPSLPVYVRPGAGQNQAIITHYFGGWPNVGNAYYDGRMGCSPYNVVHPGAAACPSWRCGQSFFIGSYGFTCEDTGSDPIEAGEVVDIWCWTGECWDKACILPCPVFNRVEVVTWQ